MNDGLVQEKADWLVSQESFILTFVDEFTIKKKITPKFYGLRNTVLLSVAGVPEFLG